MVKLQIPKNSAERLDAFLTSEGLGVSSLSNHWNHYKKLSTIKIFPNENIVSFNAGVGFDAEYELNFRQRTAYEYFTHFYGRLKNSYDAMRAFKKIWSKFEPVIQLTDIEKPITVHKAIAAHYTNIIFPHLKKQSNFCYLEIGAGSGYLSVLMHKLMGGRTFIIDLPELIPFSFLYINKMFPKADFLLPHEANLETISSMKSDFIFLTPQQINTIPDLYIDLAINTASFGEMLPEQISTYFKLLRRVVKIDGLFFTTNRVEKWMNQSDVSIIENKPDNGIPIRFHEYPWKSDDKDIFYHLSEFHAIIQPQNPMFSRLTKLSKNIKS